MTDPSIDEKIRILHFQNAIGVDNADIGLPGAGPHVQKTVERLAREIVDDEAVGRSELRRRGRTRTTSGRSSRSRSAWGFRSRRDVHRVVADPAVCRGVGPRLDHRAVGEGGAVRDGEGLPVMYVTEDTTRAKPEDVEKLYTAAIEAGAKRVCVCDTVGHATPWGVRNLIRFVRGDRRSRSIRR